MTIKDIARESGYAVGTVSRVLNGHPDVSEEARARILAVVAERRFTPNSNAKHLKQQGSRGAAIIVKGAGNLLFAGILELLQAELRARECPAFVTYLDEEDDEVRCARLLCRERRPLGILFLGSNLARFREGFAPVDAPCVLVTNSAAALGFSNLSSVSTDDVAAAKRCVEHLYASGHRRIGILGGISGGEDAASARLEGCRQGFAACGLPFDEKRQYREARFSMVGGYAAMERLLAANPKMTAVFAFSDVMALGALRSLGDHGLRAPEDISLMGFDGIEPGRFSVPRLTTVRQSGGELARRGVELLMRGIEGQGPAIHETVPFELLPGESVRNRTLT